MLEIRNLTLGYNRHPAVHHVSFSIQPGDFIAIVGPNGAGKSTLMNGLLGLTPVMEGSIDYLDIDKKDISYLPQANKVDRDFPMTVEQFVASGLWQELGLFRRLKATHIQRIHNALLQVGLEGFEKRPLDALSGGQFQRLLFARKIIQSAKLLLLDEPFTAVDENTISDLMSLLTSLNQQGATVVTIIHDLKIARDHFPKTLLLSRELISFGRTSEVLTDQNLLLATQKGFGDVANADVCAA